jgi:hypothetical protein
MLSRRIRITLSAAEAAMELPKDFDDRHWWILVGIAGALIATASAPVKFVPGFVIGLALLFFGVGQWIDHPIQTSRSQGVITTRHPWRPSVLGVTLSLGGIALFAFGAFRLLSS